VKFFVLESLDISGHFPNINGVLHSAPQRPLPKAGKARQRLRFSFTWRHGGKKWETEKLSHNKPAINHLNS
jgi:hypothetical protein